MFCGQSLSSADFPTFGPIDVGWLGCVCCAGFIITRFTVSMVSCHLLLIELDLWLDALRRLSRFISMIVTSLYAEHPSLRDNSCLLAWVRMVSCIEGSTVYAILCLSLVRWVASRELSTIGCFSELFLSFICYKVFVCCSGNL